MLTCLFYDQTWYLLNVYVQSFGYYLQYIIQLGFHAGQSVVQIAKNTSVKNKGPCHFVWGFVFHHCPDAVIRYPRTK